MNLEDQTFLSDFYEKHYKKLFLHAYAMLHSRSLAEVAVQEACWIACRKIEQLKESEHPVGWMKKAVEYSALHIKREAQRTQQLLIPLENLLPKEEPVFSLGSSVEIKDCCLNAVSADELSFFLRIATGETTFLQEAKRQNISLSTCYKRFERLRNKLQKAIQDSQQE